MVKNDIVIIAGGKGTRISSLFPGVPKALLEIGTTKLLDKILASVPYQHAYLSLGYGAKKIINHVSGTELGNIIHYAIEKEQLGAFGGLKYTVNKFYKGLSSELTVILADVFVHDISGDIMNVGFPSKNLVFFSKNDHPHDSDRIVVSDNCKVKKLIKKTDKHFPKYINTTVSGIYKFIKDDIIECPFNTGDIGTDFLPYLIIEKELFASRLTGIVKDVGTEERYTKINNFENIGKFEASSLKKRSVLFLDLDGTLIKDRESKPHKEINEPELISDIVPVVKYCNENFIPVLVITNQGDIAKGFKSVDNFLNDINKIEILLSKQEAWIDDVFWCPHYPVSGFEGEVTELKIKCDCRKPSSGLIDEAKKKWNIDLMTSVFLGDSDVDKSLADSIDGLKYFHVENESFKFNHTNDDPLFSILNNFTR